MALLDSLVAFAEQHSLRIGTIRDLIAYRRKHDHDILKLSETVFHSRFGGEWLAVSFLNKAVGSKTVALLKGAVSPHRPTLVLMHQLDFFRDALGETGQDMQLLQSAMRIIGDEGDGVVVIINQPDADALTKTVAVRDESAAERQEAGTSRDYGTGAQIFAELGVHEMILLTNFPHSPVALAGYGLSIAAERPFSGLDCS